ncbi:MAG: DUF4129 domain-containing protein [Planctomycetia bacterium]|jgi:hypothetical protein
MRLDRVQVAVRPRGILECLDLALLVCARWPLGLLVAAAVGVVPMILLNRLIFAGAEGDNALPLLGIVTALEMPWAAAPLTLYLGQVMFAERFDLSSLRHCLRAFGGAIGPQFLFQTLFRGLAFVTCVGGPVWLVLAYFMGPVIFLERGRWTATSGRSVALCQTEMGRIPLLLLLDTLLLGAGWFVVGQMLGAFTSLWQGAALGKVLEAAIDPFAEDGEAALAAVEAFVSWQSQIAFWVAASAVTIVRFFTYLDARIRHEGWDVELKFRAPRTYAGLGAAGRAAAGAVLVGLACVAAAGAAPVADTVAQSATTPDEADDLARKALMKQKPPWYDAGKDAFRPMVRVEPATRRIDDSLLGGIGAIAKWTMIAILVLLLAGAIWLVVRHGLDWGNDAGRERAAAATVLGAEALEALPEAARRHDGDLLAEAARLAAAGDHATAMVFFHGWQLVQLHGRGVIELARGKTNRRYAAEVAAAAPAISTLFRTSNRLFEDALFGRLPVAAADFAGVWERRDEFRQPAITEAAA